MTIDEAIEFADEWIKGATNYDGAQGWRIACATLAAEVRRLRDINDERVVGRYRLLEQNEVIENGDEFLEDDCITWTRVPIDDGDMSWQRWMIGVRWNPLMNVPFRRLMPNNAASRMAATQSEQEI